MIGLVSDFLPECKSKRIFGLFIHQAGIFGVKFISIFLGIIFADSKSGKILTPNDSILFGLLSYKSVYFGGKVTL